MTCTKAGRETSIYLFDTSIARLRMRYSGNLEVLLLAGIIYIFVIERYRPVDKAG